MISVVTGNNGKYNEIKEVLDKHKIKCKQENIELDEKDNTLEDTALSKARQAFSKIQKPLIVDDSGIFFEGKDEMDAEGVVHPFPGHKAKRAFEELGFDGLIKKAQSKDAEGVIRLCKAYFKCVICFTDGKTTKLFEGIVKGRITDKVYGSSPEGLPYDSIFVPEGYDNVFCLLPPKVAHGLKHRTIATEKFAEWFNGR
ncbi:MAG TPA: non-canonical purine NTP pyrophosphatase [archaeon]|nr:non-canonical purine NTP pyrophosphatase [archaeon]